MSKTRIVILALGITCCCLVSPMVAAPSFDCTKSVSSAEVLVCEDATLTALDVEVARLYGLASKSVSGERQRELKAFQRGWVKGRDDCWKADDLRSCVLASYAVRIHQLRQRYAGARAADDRGISSGPEVADCADFGAAIGITLLATDPPLAVLQWTDQFRVLSLVPSGSGSRYTGTADDGEWSFWTQGDEAILETGDGRTLDCAVEEPG